MKLRALGLIITLGCIAIHQLQKWHMLEIVRIHERPPIEVTSFFNLVMVWNHGVSFGMFSGHEGEAAIYLIILAVSIALLLSIWLWRCKDSFLTVALALVIGGALGNVIDRIRFGAVADFFDFHIMGWHYPAFNIADSSIFIGVCLLFWDSFARSKTTASKPATLPSER